MINTGNLETVIGLEVHAELNTKTKIFCGCSTVFGGSANTNVCPVCTGQPGSLPMLNEAVVECAVKLGLALNCTINRNSIFDRKNYFYPDLPKAYQISQLYFPICTDGLLEIEADGRLKSISIREIHIEEDAGKLIHAHYDSENTYVDYNRAGIPLLEIVTMPDFRSAGEVRAFIEKLREIMLYLNICDGKMQEGSLRADVNLSLREKGKEMGTRTETKNLNSLKAIEHAIQYETERQKNILSKGSRVYQETRRWNEDLNLSHPLRSKEDAQDYRYFPEPDLQNLSISEEFIQTMRYSIPEFAHEKRLRFMAEYGLSHDIAAILCVNKKTAEVYEIIAKKSGEALESAHLFTGEIKYENDLFKANIDKLSILITYLVNGKINRSVYKEIVRHILFNNVDPEKYINENKLLADDSSDVILEAINKVVSRNMDAVDNYFKGSEKVFENLMGQSMKSLNGKANPVSVRKILLEVLEDRRSQRSEAHA